MAKHSPKIYPLNVIFRFISANLLLKLRLPTMYLVKLCCNVIDDLNLSNEKTTYPMMLRNERKCQATHQITKAYILIN